MQQKRCATSIEGTEVGWNGTSQSLLYHSGIALIVEKELTLIAQGEACETIVSPLVCLSNQRASFPLATCWLLHNQ